MENSSIKSASITAIRTGPLESITTWEVTSPVKNTTRLSSESTKDPKMSAPSRVWRSRGASKTERHMALRRLPKQRSAGAPQVYPRSKYIGGSDRACSSTWDNHCASNDEVSNTEYYCIKVVILQRSSGKLVYKFSGEGH